MPWLSRALLQARNVLQAETLANRDLLAAERDRLLKELQTWSTRGRAAEAQVDILRRALHTAEALAHTAEVRRATAETREAIFRMELNTVRKERAEFLAKLLPGTNIPVPQVEVPVASTNDFPGVSFEDMGDERAASEGYKDMHDLPPSTPLRPE
jgi:hypothetical protein